MHTAQDFERIAASKRANSPETQGAFTKFMETLKEVGVAVKETADLVALIKTIARLVHHSLLALGL